MTLYASIRRRWWPVVAGLLLAAWGLSADAGTGIYWSFVNHTSQDLRLSPRPVEPGVCWDISEFPDGALVPAGRTSTYYIELGGCSGTEMTVFIDGGAYDGARVKLWADRQWGDGRFEVTRNISHAVSQKATSGYPSLYTGTSSSDMHTSLVFTGEGIRDTARVGVSFAAEHAVPPPGSYLASCNVDYDPVAGVLRTDCLDNDSRMVFDSRLRYPGLCAQGSQVSNLRGHPVCDHYVDELPRGSWLASCRPVGFDAAGGTLQAVCGGVAGGSPTMATLNAWYACEPGSTLSNRNGSLVCDRPFTAPTGSYLSACRDASYDGHALSATCRSFVPLGRLSFDYAARCAPWSEVRLDASTNQLACETPRRAVAAR